MNNRTKVYVQVQNQRTGRWHNDTAKNTYEEAVEEMRKLQEKYPKAKLRVLDKNLTTHTK